MNVYEGLHQLEQQLENIQKMRQDKDVTKKMLKEMDILEQRIFKVIEKLNSQLDETNDWEEVNLN
jgi:hypothetical protein